MRPTEILKSEKATIVLIFFLTFFIRLPFLDAIKNDPAFIMPIVDSYEFNNWALDIFHGQWLWTNLQNHPPLYAYFLAIIYKIFGYHVILVILLQYLLAALSTVLIYKIAKQLINKSVAIISAAFMTSYWFFIYVQSFLFSENLSLPLNIALLYLLIFAKESLQKYFWAGVILGLSIICRSDILLFALLILVWLKRQSPSIKRTLQSYLLFLAGCCLIVGSVVLRNYVISPEPILRTQVGANLYMGNNPAFKGTAIYMEIGNEWQDFIEMPYRELKRRYTETEANKFFLDKTLRIIKEKPRQWLALTGAKIFSVWTGRDLLASEDVYFFDKYMSSDPLAGVSTRLIFLLAIVGLARSFQARQKFLLLYLFVLSVMFIIFFQVKTRYFIPVLPIIIIFSAYAIFQLHTDLRRQRWFHALLTIAALCLLNAVSFANPLEIKPPDHSQTYYAIAKNFHARGMPQEAINYYERALNLNPRNVSAWNDLGVVFLNLKDCARATVYFEKALSINRNALRPRLNYQLCQELMSETREKKELQNDKK